MMSQIPLKGTGALGAPGANVTVTVRKYARGSAKVYPGPRGSIAEVRFNTKSIVIQTFAGMKQVRIQTYFDFCIELTILLLLFRMHIFKRIFGYY